MLNIVGIFTRKPRSQKSMDGTSPEIIDVSIGALRPEFHWMILIRLWLLMYFAEILYNNIQ